MPWHAMRDTDAGTQTPTATPEGGRLHNPLCIWSGPSWGRHHIGSVGATRAPPHGRASRDEEERYSGYFSCFVTSTIILCLPTRPLRSGSTGTHSIMPSLALRPEIGQAARSSRLGQRREEADPWKFAKPSDDFHHIVGLSHGRACTPGTLQPSPGATIMRGLIKPYPPASS